MVHLRKTTQNTLIGIFILGFLAGVVNFRVLPKVRWIDGENMATKEAIAAYLAQVESALDGLEAMAIHMDRLEPSQALSGEVGRLKGEATVSIDSAQEALDIYRNRMNRSRKWLAVLYGVEFDRQDAYANDIEVALNHLRQEVKDSELAAFKSQSLHVAHSDVEAAFGATATDYNRLKEKVYGFLEGCQNVLTACLLLTVLLFGAVVLRITTAYFDFVTKSYEALRNHAYDYDALPSIKPMFAEEETVQTLVAEVFEENKLTSEVRDVLLGHYIVDDAVEKLFEIFNEHLGVDRVGIAFVDYKRQKIMAEYGACNYGKILLGPGFEIGFKGTSLYEIIESKRPAITDDLAVALEKKPHSAPLNALVEEGIRSNLILPMTMGGAVFGMFFLSSKKPHYFNAHHMHLSEKIIYDVKGLLNRSYFTKVILTKMTHSFSSLVDQRDNETGDHIARMVQYSVIIASGLKKRPKAGYEVDDKFILDIERNASAHDIGKVGIPDEILKKPGKLTESEWTVMKTHAEIGSDIFSDLREGLQIFDPQFYKMTEDIARYHHERWDGSGYPEGLAGEAIPLSARIVAIADVFDAITSKRVYKKAFDIETSLTIIREAAGSHLDPYLVDVFFENLDDVMRVYEKHFSQ